MTQELKKWSYYGSNGSLEVYLETLIARDYEISSCTITHFAQHENEVGQVCSFPIKAIIIVKL